MKNKIPISLFFEKKQIPKNLSKFEYDFPNNFIFKSENKIYVFLDQISDLNKLQKNYYMFFVGQILHNFCKGGEYFIKFFGNSDFDESTLCLGWSLADYKFDKFKNSKKKLIGPILFHSHKKKINFEKQAYILIRDLINTPANILGPNEIYQAAKKFLGKKFVSKKIAGLKLKNEFPLISAVGQGASQMKKPLFCEMASKIKNNKKKKIFLIGKGVSFDTGGLNLKLGSGMSLMKKDMGGAANCIGLAKLIDSNNLNIDLRLLLCLVENSVSRESIRPSDIFKSRSGKYVEISDTDAEGRLIMADALTYASESGADLIIDMATLTGASRVALGTDVPSFFCNDDNLSNELLEASRDVGDPIWQLPLWENYENQLESNHADI